MKNGFLVKILSFILVIAIALPLLGGCSLDGDSIESILDLINAVIGGDSSSEESTGDDPFLPIIIPDDPDETNDNGKNDNKKKEDEIREDGEYTSADDVAQYLYKYKHLPSNFITKKKAQELGWDSTKGNLHKVAPGKSIGGDYYGNYDGNLPDGKYFECDINYKAGTRGAERLVYTQDYSAVYYTKDHYETFILIERGN